MIKTKPTEMIMNAKMHDLMNQQIKHEFESAYLYRAMSAYFQDLNWPGAAHWFQHQADEEDKHAMKFFHHLVERGGKVELLAMAKPQFEWDSPLAAWKAAFEHEKFITGKIHTLVDLAMAEKDYASMPLLQWFVDEQIEEEKSTFDVVRMMERIEGHTNGMMALDKVLGKRE